MTNKKGTTKSPIKFPLETIYSSSYGQAWLQV